MRAQGAAAAATRDAAARPGGATVVVVSADKRARQDEQQAPAVTPVPALLSNKKRPSENGYGGVELDLSLRL
uniref:Uncharacterized protein n=1 Tax=Arundo donax TaxID=35708 RepID=A0A0A9GCM0_ARUDO